MKIEMTCEAALYLLVFYSVHSAAAQMRGHKPRPDTVPEMNLEPVYTPVATTTYHDHFHDFTLPFPSTRNQHHHPSGRGSYQRDFSSDEGSTDISYLTESGDFDVSTTDHTPATEEDDTYHVHDSDRHFHSAAAGFSRHSKLHLLAVLAISALLLLTFD